MTVKKLTDKQKQAVVLIYDSRTRTIAQIAKFLSVSTRTIGRVIIEAGLAKPVERNQIEASKVMAVLYKHKITIEQLECLLDIVMVMPVIRETIATQTVRTKHSPVAHNGKQTLLPLDLPSLSFMDQQ